ncbi:hypothetical protein ACST8I_28820, partial [Klebsiella pneumoniae]
MTPSVAEQEGQQTETEATGAPQKHHYTLNQQVGSITSEFSTKRRQTRKEIFLSRMEQILPWQNMVEVIEPFYP